MNIELFEKYDYSSIAKRLRIAADNDVLSFYSYKI